MKNIIVLLFVIIPILSFSQHEDIAPDWEKEKDRILINDKMDELLNRVSFELECDTSMITYTETEKYTFYGRKRNNMNFPKRVTVKACGNTLIYLAKCPPNSYGKPKGWIMGKWVLESSEKEDK